MIYRLNVHAARALSKIPAFSSAVHRSPDGSAFITARTHELAATRGSFGATAETLDVGRREDARRRLIFSWASRANEPLPEDVKDEIILLLAVNPDQQLEYMGRGRFFNALHLPSSEGNLLWLDRAGGRRSYLFRKMESPVGQLDRRILEIESLYAGYKEWINDPGARLIISLGGGGWRLFAATAILKLVDHLLQDRSKVGEIWGSSGGALLGYVYSQGFDPQVVDELGFDVYQSRNPALGNGSPQAALRVHIQAAKDRLAGRPPTHAVDPWLDEIERKQPVAQRRATRIPFYAMATNTRRAEPTALADAQYIPPYCRELIFPCDPRDAVAASTAVPFLLTPLRGITGFTDDTWVDGSITDENPLALPFVKWMRDRQMNPSATPQRLKILSVHLNLRLSESDLLKNIMRVPVLKRARFIKHAARLIDMAFDSKTFAPVQILKAMPNVEIMCAKLTLGWMHFNSHREIPAAMRHGRTINAWKNTLHRMTPADGACLTSTTSPH